MLNQRKKGFLVLLVSATIIFVFCAHSVSQYKRIWTQVPEPRQLRLAALKDLTFTELRFLKELSHILLLEDLILPNGTVLLATTDSNYTSSCGRFVVYHMEVSKTGDYVKIFMADVTRALHKLTIEDVLLDNRTLQFVPSSSDFARKWSNSRFIECLGLNVSEAARVIPESYVNNLVVFRDFIEQYNASVFLFEGTLLGWYRECSFIRDTTDVDFAMKIEDLHDDMLSGIRDTLLFDLFWILGKKNDSLELSVYSDGIKIDVFFMYRAEKYDWIGGLNIGSRKKIRWTYPYVNEFCTGDLLGNLFTVPCNVEDVLVADYGANWTIPHSTATFVWYASSSNVHDAGEWPEDEWKNVYATFFPHITVPSVLRRLKNILR